MVSFWWIFGDGRRVFSYWRDSMPFCRNKAKPLREPWIPAPEQRSLSGFFYQTNPNFSLEIRCLDFSKLQTNPKWGVSRFTSRRPNQATLPRLTTYRPSLSKNVPGDESRSLSPTPSSYSGHRVKREGVESGAAVARPPSLPFPSVRGRNTLRLGSSRAGQGRSKERRCVGTATSSVVWGRGEDPSLPSLH